ITDPNDPLYSVRDFTDTVKAGPLIAGGGGGMNFEATRRVSVVVEAPALAGFPTFGFVLDGNVGLQFNFYSETEISGPSGSGRYVPKEEDEEPKYPGAVRRLDGGALVGRDRAVGARAAHQIGVAAQR